MSGWEFEPKELYAIPSVLAGKKTFKVGFADWPTDRKSTHQTSRPDFLEFGARAFYAAGLRAETYVKSRLTELGHHVRGEHFDAPLEVIKRIFQEAMARDDELAKLVSYTHHRLSLNVLVPAHEVQLEVSDNSALQYLLEHPVQRKGLATTVRAVLFDAFDLKNRARMARAVAKLGLILIPEADIVLLDKRPGSKLHGIFERGTGDKTWLSHLRGIAGLGRQLNLITVREFVAGPWATPQLLGVCVD